MNKLTFFRDGLVSSIEDLEMLAQKKTGKILVMSDSHGMDTDIISEVVEVFGQDVDVMLFCGDGISDIGEVIQEALSNEKLQEKLPELIAFVRGNNDPGSYVISAPWENQEKTEEYNEKQNFKIIQINIPESINFNLAGRRIFATHGHRHCVNYNLDLLYTIADRLPADIVFYGHTHRAYTEENHGSLILNPGSLCLPRGGQEPMLAVVSFPGVTERYQVEYFSVSKNLLGSFVFSPIMG